MAVMRLSVFTLLLIVYTSWASTEPSASPMQEQDRAADAAAASGPGVGAGVSAEDRQAALSLSGEEAFLRRGR